VGLPVAVVEGFREVNVGELEMQPPSAENWALYLSIFRRWFDGEHEVAMPGGEDYVTLWARMQTGFRQVLEGRSGQTVAIVGHGGCISAVLQELCPDVDVRIVWDVPSHNCSVTEMVFERSAPPFEGRLLAWSKAEHLYGAAAELVPGIPERAAARSWETLTEVAGRDGAGRAGR
jgi:broad specificity phosphatase PhoE